MTHLYLTSEHRLAMATSASNDAKRLDIAESHFGAAGEPWLTRTEWIWTLFGLGLLITFLRFAIDHP